MYVWDPIPLVPKIPLGLGINSQLLTMASAHLLGGRPCVFLLCSLTGLEQARLLTVWRLLRAVFLPGMLFPRLLTFALQVSA